MQKKGDTGFFSDMISPQFNPAAVLDISAGGKVLVISDFHMGIGRRDDMAANGELLINLLEKYYLSGGWYLALNGDIEELQRHSFTSIRESWPRMYRIFDRFAAENRLFKIIGNHDEALVFEKNYPYPLYSAVRIETGLIPIYVYHGHQSSRIYTNYNHIIGASLRYVLKPFGIRNISSARSPHRRFFVEKQAYNFSLQNRCISIIGHTHRALFASLGRFDYIKFEIERLCLDYPASSGADRERIAAEVKALRQELGKLKSSERRDVLRASLYGDELPVPCLFNSGSAIGRKGINAIELDIRPGRKLPGADGLPYSPFNSKNIALVYWFTKGEGKKFISRGSYEVEKMPGTPYCRSVLNRDRLDNVKARIELLGDPVIPRARA